VSSSPEGFTVWIAPSASLMKAMRVPSGPTWGCVRMRSSMRSARRRASSRSRRRGRTSAFRLRGPIGLTLTRVGVSQTPKPRPFGRIMKRSPFLTKTRRLRVDQSRSRSLGRDRLSLVRFVPSRSTTNMFELERRTGWRRRHGSPTTVVPAASHVKRFRSAARGWSPSVRRGWREPLERDVGRFELDQRVCSERLPSRGVSATRSK
jgi:hypothetical protein